MPDYGHDLLFGVFLPPVADESDAVLSLATAADRLGLDLISCQDHPYQPAYLDAWTLLSVIAATTSRARVFPNVANLPLREPAVLAKAVASLDILSGGRVELGLGAGAFWDAIEAMGGPRRTPGEAVAALEEAIAVVKALWTPGRGARLEGRHYRLAGAKPGPVPAHPVGVWLGAYGRRMLQLTGRVADGWLPSAPYAAPEVLSDMNAVIDEAAAAAGRSPAAVRRLYNVNGSLTGDGTTFLQGPPAVWVEQLADLALSEGISGFVLMVDPGSRDLMEVFAEEIAPGVRGLVDSERRASKAGQPQPGGSAAGGSGRGESAARVGTAARAAVTIRATEPPESATPATHTDEAENLGVTPTPDDGRRLTAKPVWDESTRPESPTPDASVRYTDGGRSDGQHLIDIHDHLRGELAQIRELVQQVAAGSTDAASARSTINAMTIRQNNWTLGAYCQSYCRILTLHHTLEDRAMFPRIRRADPRLAPVVDRLAEEHEIIADVLNQVDAALVALVERADAVDEVQHAVDVLTDALLSHLSYEERQLVEPLARLSLGFTAI